MLKDIVEARPLGRHRLHLRFEDGTEGEVDIATLLDFTDTLAPLPSRPHLRRPGHHQPRVRHHNLAQQHRPRPRRPLRGRHGHTGKATPRFGRSLMKDRPFAEWLTRKVFPNALRGRCARLS